MNCSRVVTSRPSRYAVNGAVSTPITPVATSACRGGSVMRVSWRVNIAGAHVVLNSADEFVSVGEAFVEVARGEP
jgi:hypothetical protein